MVTETGTARGLTGNALKILALVTMTCDHIGQQLLPQYSVLRIVGRLAFPIFAYMIAEGCTYTKNRKQYLLMMAGLGLLCQIVYFIAMQSLYLCVLVTFSLATAMIYLLDYAKEKGGAGQWLVIFGVAVVWFLCTLLPDLLPHTDFHIDYGVWGVFLPVFVYAGRNRTEKLVYFAVGLVLLALSMGDIQWYALAAVPLMALYTGKRGKYRMKYLFYIYYPLHLAVIYAISLVI